MTRSYAWHDSFRNTLPHAATHTATCYLEVKTECGQWPVHTCDMTHTSTNCNTHRNTHCNTLPGSWDRRRPMTRSSAVFCSPVRMCGSHSWQMHVSGAHSWQTHICGAHACMVLIRDECKSVLLIRDKRIWVVLTPYAWSSFVHVCDLVRDKCNCVILIHDRCMCGPYSCDMTPSCWDEAYIYIHIYIFIYIYIYIYIKDTEKLDIGVRKQYKCIYVYMG